MKNGLIAALVCSTSVWAADVHTVLESRCRSCHTGESAQAELRIDTRADLVKGGISGPAIVPGKSAESLLIQKVTGQRGTRMPPAGPPLNEAEVAALRNWIDEGAPWRTAGAPPDRLAAMPPRRPSLPPGTSPNPVDRFVSLAVHPVSDAVFARRAYLDLHGLLPTPEQIRAFVDDVSPDKRSALIDRLLANREAYAEHWMSFFNDLLRNDEGVAYHGERKSITPWLFGALEKNLPYNLMVEMLLNPAAEDDPDGFVTGITWRGVVSASQTPPMQAAQNSAQVFLGMNLKCAACHDSFVNRWKLKDTFGLAAMFAEDPLELVRCDVPTGTVAEARFPVDFIKLGFDWTVESRRAAVAAWFTSPENGRFARTVVNRYWRLLFGRGIVEPIDDMDAPAWSQDLLDWLASDFVDHEYDLQHLLRRLMTSKAYQSPTVPQPDPAQQYVFAGPHPRRLTAEQFQDAISAVSGDWRVRVPRGEVEASYTREWRLKSDPLSRALGRPIRDQVYTDRNTQPSTLQALELTNGPLLSHRLERAAKALMGQLKPAPANRFDSRMVRGSAKPFEIDVGGADALWLVVQDVDSYDPSRIEAGWASAELIRSDGTAVPLSQNMESMKVGREEVQVVKAGAPSVLKFAVEPGAVRFRARPVIAERSRKSDIGPALRFFAFTEQPDLDRLVRVDGTPPSFPPKTQWTADELIERLYLHLFSRAPSTAEREVARTMLGSRLEPACVEDLLWSMVMSPEFQYIR